MKDYAKNAAVRRARVEVTLVFREIQEQIFDRVKEYIDGASAKAITDGSPFDANEVGKAAAAYGSEPWGGISSKPALEHKPSRASKARNR